MLSGVLAPDLLAAAAGQGRPVGACETSVQSVQEAWRACQAGHELCGQPGGEPMFDRLPYQGGYMHARLLLFVACVRYEDAWACYIARCSRALVANGTARAGGAGGRLMASVAMGAGGFVNVRCKHHEVGCAVTRVELLALSAGGSGGAPARWVTRGERRVPASYSKLCVRSQVAASERLPGEKYCSARAIRILPLCKSPRWQPPHHTPCHGPLDRPRLGH